MALPDPKYIAFQGLETYFVNKDDGAPLSAGYATFYKDTGDQNVLKDVFQQVRQPDNTYEFVNIGSTVVMTSVGTFSSPSDGSDIQVYAYPYDESGNIELYHIAVYSSDDILQFTRDAQPANFLDDGGDVETFIASDNQISNPQFVEVLFVPDSGLDTHTFNVTGTNTSTPVAPGWSIVTTGTGTVTVEQVALSTDPIAGNPPYSLYVQSAGLDSIKLRQRFQGDPRFFLNSFVSTTILVRSRTSVSVDFQVDYVPSDVLAEPFVLLEGIAPGGGTYTTLSNTANTTPDTGVASTDTAPTGYVDIDVSFTPGSTIEISNIQIVTVENSESSASFVPDSLQRQQDHLFNYWQPYLNYKPIPSYLVGWDFPMNPAQFGATQAASAIGATKSKYVWDQTILFQTTNSGVGVTRASQGSIVLTAAAAGSCAIIQYLEQEKAREILATTLSVNVSAYSNVDGGLPATVSLWYTTDATLPQMSSNNSLVSSLDANGYPTCGNGTWNVVTRGSADSLGKAVFTIESAPSTGQFNNYSFSGWDSTAATAPSTATFFAIVIGFANIPITKTVTIQSVSLVPGNIPTIPAPKTYDETFRECQRYYETNYPVGTVSGANTTNLITTPAVTGITSSAGAVNGIAISAPATEVIFNTIKVNAPAVTITSEAGTAANVSLSYYFNGTVKTGPTDCALATSWSAAAIGTKLVSYTPKTSVGLASLGATANLLTSWISYNYVADARLGTY